MNITDFFHIQTVLCAGLFALLFLLEKSNTKAEKTADKNNIPDIG